MEEDNIEWNNENCDWYYDHLTPTDEQGRPLSEPMTRGELIERFERLEFDLFMHLLYIMLVVSLFLFR